MGNTTIIHHRLGLPEQKTLLQKFPQKPPRADGLGLGAMYKGKILTLLGGFPLTIS